MSLPVLVSVDWGTSSFRALLAASDGGVIEAVETDQGALGLPAGAHERFLASKIGGWLSRFPNLPIMISGMAGARHGWFEAPYVPCPAGAGDIAARVLALETSLGRVFIIPGVSAPEAPGGPDVMRGEETQLLGALAATRSQEGLFVLPGSHSKWVRIEAGGIAGFATFMTGEAFAALRDHTVLGRLMAPGGGPARSGQGFTRGLAAASKLERPGDLLNAIFKTRTLGLFDALSQDALADFLSGLLIGAEILAGVGGETQATIIGSAALCARYRGAGDALGIKLTQAPENCATLGQIALLERLKAL
jgi:2-dehydro-3-deoxygalactonokinase